MSKSASGYELSAVASVRCLLCGELIGEVEYKEIRTLARFGQMLFEHVECPV